MYKNPVLFDSRNIKYKNPFGAVSIDRKIFITFPVAKELYPDRVKLFLRRNTHVTGYELINAGEKGDYVYFELQFMVNMEGTYTYRFEIYSGDRVYYCGKGKGGQAILGEWLPEWQLSVYQRGYKTADFIKGGVVYHIFCDRFNKAGEEGTPKYGVKKNWDEDVTVIDPDGKYRANDFYGGNFDGIIEKLGYLKYLGVTAIYLSPIFESVSNHRYDTGDYMKIDELLGGEDAFGRFMAKCKEYGISVILDGVFNHTGADSVYFNRFGHYDSIGACQGPMSKYYDWFTFYNFPDDYHCWWGCTNVPTVARSAVGYRELIAGDGGVIEKWMNKGVKGWRLDVVDELSEYFVKRIRAMIKKCDEDGLVLGEVWEDASTKYSYGEEREYFFGEDLDGVMNYVYKVAINEYILTGDCEKFVESVLTIMENYPKESLDTCFTLIDSHDTVRAINVYAGVNGENMSKVEKKEFRLSKEQYELGKKRLKLAACLQYFLPGVPSLYYGDEAGLQGFEDPLNRRPYPWGKEDKELLGHYAYLGRLRTKYREDFKGPTVIYEEYGKVFIERGRARLRVDTSDLTFSITIEERR